MELFTTNQNIVNHPPIRGNRVNLPTPDLSGKDQFLSSSPGEQETNLINPGAFSHTASNTSGTSRPGNTEVKNLAAAADILMGKKTPGANMIWEVDLNLNFPVESGYVEPVIRDDGIYLSNEGTLKKYDFAGNELWRSSIGGTKNKTPVFDDRGNSYVLSSGYDGTEAMLSSYAPDGTTRWMEPAGDYISLRSPLMQGDKLYTVCSDRTVKCFDLEGSEVWAVHVQDVNTNPPVLDSHGKLHVDCYGDLDNTCEHKTIDTTSFDREGKPLIETTGKWPFGKSPLVDQDGNQYGYKAGAFRSFDGTGNLRWWTELLSGTEHISTQVGPDGSIYTFSMKPDTLTCISPDGEKLWEFQGKNGQEKLSNQLAWGNDGTLYLTGSSSNPRLYALDPSGKVKWSSLKQDSELGKITVGPRGEIYTGDRTAKIRGFSPDNGSRIFESNLRGTVFTSPQLGDNDFIAVTEKQMLRIHFAREEEFQEQFEELKKENTTPLQIRDEGNALDLGDGVVLNKRKKRI